jgi:acetolactate synthase-1/2/3 large subunit
VDGIGLLAQEFVRLGVRDVFGIPGEGPSLDLINELDRHGSKFHSVCHEAAGALMAGGYGRVMGAPGICLSIKGPGFANMLAGIASNWLDRNPVVSLSESYGPGSSADRMHKRLSHRAIVTPLVKAYADNPAPELISKLWNVCMAEEPGPVHIDISNSLTAATYDSSETESDLQPLPRDVADSIKSAARPVIIAGSLATRRPWRKRLADLRIPVFTTVAGKGALDEAQPWAAGIFTNAGGPLAHERTILSHADLIVGLGLRTTEILDVRPLPARLILLDELGGRAQGLGAAVELLVKEEGFHDALNLLTAKEWGTAELRTAKARLFERMEIHRWLPAGVFALIQNLLPDSTRYVLDTGHFCTIGEHVLAAHYPGQVMGSAYGRSMGVGIPTGLGAALATRGTLTVIIVGDGGVRMYPEAITLAVRERMPVLILMMNDGSYASVRQAAVRKGYSQTPLFMPTGSWPGIFHGFGCPSERIESFAALTRAIESWKQASGPLFLDLAFDPEAYLCMTEGIR